MGVDLHEPSVATARDEAATRPESAPPRSGEVGGDLRDSVTGLRNLAALHTDLASIRGDLAAMQSGPGNRWMLVLLELDDFQSFVDRAGGSAADRLLERVAGQLAQSASEIGGIAYRLDTSLLGVLSVAGAQGPGRVVAMAAVAMDDEEEDLVIGRSYGHVTLPDEAIDPDTAIRIADERLASRRHRRHKSERRQAHAVLMAVLRARRPDLRDHVRSVAYRAMALGRRLELDREQIEDLAMAAGLQDVGMLAVPESILEKQGSLDEEELAQIRQHPLEGERIVSKAPGLVKVAEIVRASYERFDGSGYPDGIAGEEIPLGARVIAVAVAFAAMTSDRPHSPARNAPEALRELRSCAGTQFDPRVVEALAEDLTEEGAI